MSDSIESPRDRGNASAYDAFFAMSPDMFCIVSFDGRFLDVNDAWEETLGYERKALIGERFMDFVHSDDQQTTLEVFSGILSGRSVANFVNRYRRTDGSHRWLEWHSKASEDRCLVYAVAVDITERHHTMEHLLEQQRIVSSIANAARDAIVMMTPDGRVIFWNEAASRMFGYTREEISDKDLHRTLVPDRFHEDHDRGMKEFVLTGSGPIVDQTIGHVARHRDGHEFPVEISVTAVMLEGAWHAVGIIRDVTERTRAEEALLASEAMLREVNAEKDRFFSIIAHDLRSPLGTLQALTEVLMDSHAGMTQMELSDVLRSMHRSAGNVNQLLENLLEWARMQKDRSQFEPAAVPVSVLIHESIALLQDTTASKGISVRLDIPEELVVKADRRMLDGVVRNLFSNAVKFTRAGGRIQVSARRRDGMAEITVRDSGIGMPSELLANLFRIDRNTGRLGTNNEPTSGLGLVLVREFVEKNGGRIRADSAEGQGSTFTFTVPLFPESG